MRHDGPITQEALDRILPYVTRPARYAGGEWNSIRKDWEAAEVRMALVYPDVYEVGMSNLGLAILYELLNAQPQVLAERAYTPWPDMEAAMRGAGLPLFSLESRRPLSHFDIVGFSLGYELTYTNVLKTLELAGIPVLASARGPGHPLVVAGGSCALNPEPMADFFDLFVVGEGEEVVPELVEVYRRWKGDGRGDREELLRRTAAIPGVYVPSFYHVAYHPDGTVASITPNTATAPEQVARRWVRRLPPPPVKPVVPYVQIIHDRAAVEIQRGCSRGCRFCQAGLIYRPPRERPLEEVLEAAEGILRHTGHSELSFISLSSSDYSRIESLVAEVAARHREDCLAISLPSLRMDSFSVRLSEALQKGRRTGLTFAPEAGTQRLRQAINKVATEEDLFQAAEAAFSRGWNGIKLYFLVGLPGETESDVQGIVRLVKQVREIGYKYAGHRLNLRVSVASFVPKAHTPFHWVAQEKEEALIAKIGILQRGLRRTGVHLSWQDPKVSLLEGALSRGDRRLGRVILRAWELGCSFDAWDEHFRFDRWEQAFRESGLDPAFYAQRERPLEEVLPWAHIHPGVSQSFLKREWLRSLRLQATADCKVENCSACGLQALPGGCQVVSLPADRQNADGQGP